MLFLLLRVFSIAVTVIVTALGIVEISLLYDFSHTLFFSFLLFNFQGPSSPSFADSFSSIPQSFSFVKYFFKSFFAFFKLFFGTLFSRSRLLPDSSLACVLFLLSRRPQFPCPLHRSACLIYHFLPGLSTSFYYNLRLCYTHSGVSSIY